MRVFGSVAKGAGPTLLVFYFLSFLWVASASSRFAPSKTTVKGKPYSPEKQVGILIDSIYSRHVPKFSSKKFPIFGELKKASQVVKLFMSHRFNLDDLQDPEKARKIDHRLKHFKFYTDPSFQMRALLFYPRGINQHTSGKYLQFVRSFLPLFRDWHHWHIILDNLSLIKEGETRRLPEIFHSEDEEHLKQQYCAFLRVERQETRARLVKLLPALRLGKTYKCDKDDSDEGEAPTLGEFFELFETEGKLLNVGSSEDEGSSEEDDELPLYQPSSEDDDGNYQDDEENPFAGQVGACGGARSTSSTEEPVSKEKSEIKVHLHFNQGRFS